MKVGHWKICYHIADWGSKGNKIATTSTWYLEIGSRRRSLCSGLWPCVFWVPDASQAASKETKYLKLQLGLHSDNWQLNLPLCKMKLQTTTKGEIRWSCHDLKLKWIYTCHRGGALICSWASNWWDFRNGWELQSTDGDFGIFAEL